MTRTEYIKRLRELYLAANNSDNENKANWMRGDECAVHCQAYDKIIQHMGISGLNWLEGEEHSDEELSEIARGGIERHLGDVCDGGSSADAIYDEAYTLGFDALVDAGVSPDIARQYAREQAQLIAQP